MTLLDALYAFYREYEHCGDLDSSVDGDRVWMACTWYELHMWAAAVYS